MLEYGLYSHVKSQCNVNQLSPELNGSRKAPRCSNHRGWSQQCWGPQSRSWDQSRWKNKLEKPSRSGETCQPFPFIIVPDLGVEGDGPGNKVNPTWGENVKCIPTLLFNDKLKKIHQILKKINYDVINVSLPTMVLISSTDSDFITVTRTKALLKLN